MTPLRQQMIRELQLQRKSTATIEAYVAAVAHLAQFYHRSPDQLAVEQVRQFIHHLIVERKLSRDTVNQKICGIQLFYRYVLRQAEYSLRVPLKRRMKEGIPFDAPDGRPVNIACILLVPEKATDKHLQILSELAQMFSDKQFREGILQCRDAAKIHKLIVDWKPNVED